MNVFVKLDFMFANGASGTDKQTPCWCVMCIHNAREYNSSSRDPVVGILLLSSLHPVRVENALIPWIQVLSYLHR